MVNARLREQMKPVGDAWAADLSQSGTVTKQGLTGESAAGRWGHSMETLRTGAPSLTPPASRADLSHFNFLLLGKREVEGEFLDLYQN